MTRSTRNSWALALGLAPALLGLCGAPAAADEVQDPAAAERAAEKAKWGEHWGDLPFVVGYEKGMEEVEFTGRPPMYFFTTTW